MINRKIILGSKSPRRKYLLEQGNFQVEVRPFDVEEIYPSDLDPYKVPEFLAELKIAPVQEILGDNDIALTADTVVILNNEILGKPKNREQAIDYIKRMSGCSHDVITGVCIQDMNKRISFSVKSIVHFAEFTMEEIKYYIDNYNPYDKAGAYGIQDWIGWTKIKSIEGSYSNIMGLPMQEVYEAMLRLSTNS